LRGADFLRVTALDIVRDMLFFGMPTL
jgi:hypothetical protein